MSGIEYTADEVAIATRLRSLLFANGHRRRLRSLAAELQLDVESLRESVDTRGPHPSVEVMLAVVRHYGIDPNWLLTGDYDVTTHREALEDLTSAARLLTRTSLRRDNTLAGLLGAELLDLTSHKSAKTD